MKFIKTFIIFILIISCSDKKTEINTSEFDKVLGKENIKTLDFLVSDFENDFLKRQYPDLDTENAYRQFLTELRDEKTKNRKSISEKARNKFKLSDLRLEMDEFPKQNEKLHLLVYSTLGIDVERVNEIKFNYELAKESLRFYKSEDIPKIEDINIPKAVSNLRFTSNLLNSKPIDSGVDKLYNLI